MYKNKERQRAYRKAYSRRWWREHHLNKVWANMRQRCYNSNCPAYVTYGARGIKILWEDFDSFKSWALNHGYREGLSIDRVDNDGDYSPSNCQWIPLSENGFKAAKITYASAAKMGSRTSL